MAERLYLNACLVLLHVEAFDRYFNDIRSTSYLKPSDLWMQVRHYHFALLRHFRSIPEANGTVGSHCAPLLINHLHGRKTHHRVTCIVDAFVELTHSFACIVQILLKYLLIKFDGKNLLRVVTVEN